VVHLHDCNRYALLEGIGDGLEIIYKVAVRMLILWHSGSETNMDKTVLATMI
jgi:hypothetical protein